MYFTVGRNPQSNIVITGYDVVSFDHATLEYDDQGQWLFIDDSSNGSLVNGQLFHHASCPIKQGDVIMLAGVCPLPWERIQALVPAAAPQQPVNSRPTQIYTPQAEPQVQQPMYQQPQQPVYQAPQQQYQQPQSGNGKSKELDRKLDKWNWGAFCLTWIWGVCNNAYLMLIALLPIGHLVMAIIGGVKGTRWAWEGGNWKEEDYKRFEERQKGWMIAGLIVLGITVLFTIMLFSFASTLFSGLFGFLDIFDFFSDFDDIMFFL